MIKNALYGVMLGILIQQKYIQKELHKTIKKINNDLDYDGVEFSVREKDFTKFEMKNNICINVFYYKNKLTFPIYISDQTFENSTDLLLIINENKSYYVCIKDFDRSMFHKTKNKNKKQFCKSCLL